jgi:hypothetical protein
MTLLEKDPRGYPVPWFVDRAAPPKDGGPDFRVMDGRRLKLAIRERRCWVCGLRLRSEIGTFVAGPMCGVNRTSAEPPCHRECAIASAKRCPFLSHPGRIRDEDNLPAGMVAGVGIKRNPGVTMLWTSAYETWRPPGGGLLFEMGEPSEVLWLRMGRPATRAEVWASVESGEPLLREQCFTDEDHVALDAYITRFRAYLPPSENCPDDAPEGCAQGDTGRKP